jgi:hypothetical protein
MAPQPKYGVALWSHSPAIFAHSLKPIEQLQCFVQPGYFTALTPKINLSVMHHDGLKILVQK